MNGFKKTLYYSQLVEEVNNCHNSIISNELNIVPFRKFTPTTGIPYSQTIDFGFALSQYYTISYDDFIRSKVKAVYSTPFTYNGKQCSLQDDNNGNLVIYTVDSLDNNVAQATVGTVDYSSGKVIINNIVIESYTPASGSHIHLYVNPLNKDITSSKNFIIAIADSDIEVSVIPVKV